MFQSSFPGEVLCLPVRIVTAGSGQKETVNQYIKTSLDPGRSAMASVRQILMVTLVILVPKDARGAFQCTTSSINAVSFNCLMGRHYLHTHEERRESEGLIRSHTACKLECEYKPTDPVYKSSVLLRTCISEL